MTARVRGNKLRFGSRIFSAIQGTNRVNGTVRFTVRLVLEKGAFIWQLTTRPAANALTFAVVGDRQYRGKSPLYFSRPCIYPPWRISLFISHNLLLGQSRFCETKPAVKPQAKYLDTRFTWDSHSSDVENNVCPIGKEKCKDQNPGN